MGKMVFLGVEGSGKTSLAMALLRAFDSRKSEGWYMRPLSRDSFRFVETMPRDFLNEGFPAQTADLRELRWQLEWNGEDFGEIEILDYPGEIYRLAFLDEKDERDKEAFRQKVVANKKDIDALLDAIKDAEEVFVLFSLEDAIDIKDKPRNLDAVWITYECLNTLKRLDPKPEIKLLFTQADKYRDVGLDLEKPAFNGLDLIVRNHGDVPRQFLSVIDSPNSEFGIEELVRIIVSKRIVSSLRRKFGDEVVDDIFVKKRQNLWKKLRREIDQPWGKKELKSYRLKLGNLLQYVLAHNYESWQLPSFELSIDQLIDIKWATDCISLFYLKNYDNNLLKKLCEDVSMTKLRTKWGEAVQQDLITLMKKYIRNNKFKLWPAILIITVFVYYFVVTLAGIIINSYS